MAVRMGRLDEQYSAPMNGKGDSLNDLIDLLRKRGPECIDILSAKTEDEFERLSFRF